MNEESRKLHYCELEGMRAVDDDPEWRQMDCLGLESGLWERVRDSHDDDCSGWGMFVLGPDDHEFFKESEGLYCGSCGTKTGFPRTWNGVVHEFWSFGLLLNADP